MGEVSIIFITPKTPSESDRDGVQDRGRGRDDVEDGGRQSGPLGRPAPGLEVRTLVARVDVLECRRAPSRCHRPAPGRGTCSAARGAACSSSPRPARPVERHLGQRLDDGVGVGRTGLLPLLVQVARPTYEVTTTSTLYTEELQYDVNPRVGVYRHCGRVVNGKSVLTSKNENHPPERYLFQGRCKAEILPTFLSDSLLYNTN